MKRIILWLGLLLAAADAHAQQALLQGGSQTAGHAPMYQQSGTAQPIVLDSGPAGGNKTGQGLSEINVTARGNACNTAQAPVVCAGQGTGQLGTIVQIQDAISTNSGGYHALSFTANDGSGALLAYNAFGAASALPLRFNVNGTYYSFPFVTGGIVGPGTTVVGHPACWNNTVGTLLSDCTFPALSPGGSANQIQYNSGGTALAGFTMSGDCTVVVATGVLTCTKVNGQTVSLGGTLTTAAAFTQAGAFATTLTSVGATNVTLPQTGTLATLAGSEALTNKSINGLTVTPSTGTLSITNGKSFAVQNSLTLTATDGSSLNIGAGGTLASAAYTSASAYVPSNTQVSNSLSGDVSMNNTSNYFDGPSVAQGSSGTWFFSGTVTLRDTAAGPASMSCKLWDGTTVISSAQATTGNANNLPIVVSLSGSLATPAGNGRISCKDTTATTGVILFNSSGNSKDSTITAFRLN